MLQARTYIVRIYRRDGTRNGRLSGVVEVVAEQRCVAFAGFAALRHILMAPSALRRNRASRAKHAAGDVD